MVQDINSIWPNVLEEIKKRVTEQQFNTWFRRLEPEGLIDGKLALRVPGPIYREWLARRYKSLIEEAFSSVRKGPVSVTFTLGVAPAHSPTGSVSEGGVAPPSSPQMYLNRRYTFENFVVGHCNRLAHAAALSVVSSPGYTYNPLFVYGGAGLGKSHLLQATYFSLLQKGLKALYVPCGAFVSHFVFALRNQQLDAFRKAYRELDALLLDDVQQISNAPSTREELFHTINSLFNKQRQVVFAASVSPDMLPGVEERLVSRFKWGLLAKLDPADLETLTIIVERMALHLDLRLTREASSFLAENAPENLKELERLLGFLSSLYSPAGFPLSLRQVKEALLGLLPEKNRLVHMDDIIKTVSLFFRIPQSKLQSRSRTRAASLPRQVVMYLARRFTALSLEEVGGYLGGRDHSTVVHAERRIETLKAESQEIGSIINQIEASLLRRC